MSIADFFNDFSGYMPGYWKASLAVVKITFSTVLLSWVFGLVAALGKTAKNRIINKIFSFYVWFIRGTPALIQIFIVYFGLSQWGLRLPPFLAGVLALSLNSGAYVAEIIRGGLMAIPAGQKEAAISLGMREITTYKRIILPQVVRIILPPITNEMTAVLKNTSLLSTITIMELTLFTQIIVAATFRPFQFYIATALFYLIMTTLLMRLSKYLENKQEIAYK